MTREVSSHLEHCLHAMPSVDSRHMVGVASRTEVTMNAMRTNLPGKKLAKLRQKPVEYGITPEDLVRGSIEQLLDEPEEGFKKSADYVLKKNEELYQRLA